MTVFSYADRGFQEVKGQSVSNIYDNIKDGKPVELKDIYDIVGAVYTSPELLAGFIRSYVSNAYSVRLKLLKLVLLSN